MNYQSQEEHDYYENGAAQVQAEYEQQESYYEFLNQLIKNEKYQLHAIYVALDTLSSAGNKDFNPAMSFLVDLKNYVNNNNLVDNEFKLGQALIELFDNYGNIFIGNDNNKFNKNIVLLSLREMTNMNTKEIRIFLKKYKSLYLETVKKIHNQ